MCRSEVSRASYQSKQLVSKSSSEANKAAVNVVDFKKRKPVPLPRKQLPHPATTAAQQLSQLTAKGGKSKKESDSKSTSGGWVTV